MNKSDNKLPISRPVLSALFRSCDPVIVAIAGLGSYWVYLHGGSPEPIFLHYLVVIGVAVFLALNAFQFANLYRWPQMDHLAYQLMRLTVAWLLVWFSLIAIAFLLKVSDNFSRVWMVSWLFSVLVLLTASRFALKFAIRRWTRQGRLIRRGIIIGTGPQGERFAAHLKAMGQSDLAIVAAFDDRGERSPNDLCGIPVLGATEDAVAFARAEQLDEVIIALPWSAEERLIKIMHMVRMLPLNVHLASDNIGYQFLDRHISTFAEMPFVPVFERPISGWNHVSKTIEDKVLAMLALIMFAPLMLIIALAIRLETPGPVLFRQRRYGFNEELIEILKFRTMYHDQADYDANLLVRRNDPRVTRVGAWLRRLSLDELPQFINVLNGEMSIVGPRPHAVSARAGDKLYQDVVADYAARHRVKPGITGWAQVNGWRGETDSEEKIRMRVKHDLDYIENWSLRFDLYIIGKTVWSGAVFENAY